MFKTSYRYVGDVFQTIIYLGTLTALYIHRINIIKLRVIQLFIFSLIIQIISWYSLYLLDPEYNNVLSLTWLGYFFVFFFIAYWLKGDDDKINITLIAFSIGVILTCLLHSNDIYSDYSKITKRVRVGYNFMNANHSAALLATSLIIITYIASKTKLSIGKIIPLLVLVTTTIFLLMGTQSRSAYIALAIPFVILFFSSFKRKKGNLFSVCIIIFATLVSFIYSSLPRVNYEVNVLQEKYEQSVENNVQKPEILIDKNSPTGKVAIKEKPKTNEVMIPVYSKKNPVNKLTLREKTINKLDNISEDVPDTNVGIRILSWIDTIKQFLFNPILGLGNNANTYILEHSNHADMYNKYKIRHLHSSYMELIASYGLVGIILLTCLYSHVFKIVRNRGSRDILVFAVCLYSFLGVLNLFESYLFVKSGVLIHTLVLGVLYSYNFKGDVENEAK
ncbi:O-antigen ligase family protein [Vibrio lentus]